MTNLTDLEQLAKAATPGPWRRDARGERSGFEHVFAGNDDGPGQTVAQWTLPSDAAYIAAASPDVVLRLIAVARAARDHLRGEDIYGLADALAALGDEP